MKTAVVNFKTTPEIKKKAQEYAKEQGLALSALLNQELYKIANAQILCDAPESSQKISNTAEEALLDRALMSSLVQKKLTQLSNAV